MLMLGKIDYAAKWDKNDIGGEIHQVNITIMPSCSVQHNNKKMKFDFTVQSLMVPVSPQSPPTKTPQKRSAETFFPSWFTIYSTFKSLDHLVLVFGQSN